MSATPDRADLTPRDIRIAAHWLRAQAARVAVERATLQRQRIAARLRVAGQQRDAQGRWTA